MAYLVVMIHAKVYNKKRHSLRECLFNNVQLILFWLSCSCWANASARTTIDTFILVDGVDWAFRNTVYWTFWFASTTSDASISNYMCHIHFLLKHFVDLI